MAIDDMIQGKILDTVFDKNTLMTLYSLESAKIIKALESPISTGKEAVVFRARSPEGAFLAVKLYLVKNCNYKKMFTYLQGDSRFAGIKNNKQSIVFAFCAKENRNLQRAYELGINCPRPLAYKDNVLVEEFIGDEEGNPAPRMKDHAPEDPEAAYAILKKYIEVLWKGGLVHGDLSEYNILISNEVPWVIDMSQSVLISHPNAREYLKRDIHNINKYFEKRKVKTSDFFDNLIKEA